MKKANETNHIPSGQTGALNLDIVLNRQGNIALLIDLLVLIIIGLAVRVA